MTTRVLVQPTVEPLTLAQAKIHCDIPTTFTDHDALITSFIVAARKYAENYTRRTFVQRTYELSLPFFPLGDVFGGRVYGGVNAGQISGIVELPFPPLISVDYVKYTALDGTIVTIDPALYQVDTYREPGLLKPAYLQYWPIIFRNDFNAVRIGYTAGYPAVGSPASDLDYAGHSDLEPLKNWIRMRVATMYDNPSAVITGTIVGELQEDFVDAVLDQYVVDLFI